MVLVSWLRSVVCRLLVFVLLFAVCRCALLLFAGVAVCWCCRLLVLSSVDCGLMTSLLFAVVRCCLLVCADVRRVLLSVVRWSLLWFAGCCCVLSCIVV